MSVRFGTDGVRGLAGAHPIVPEVGLALGRAVAVWSEGPVLVARDTRPSGASLTAAVMAGAAAQGALVRDLGIAPTPAVGCALADGLGAAAVVVTASHNAWPDNGFKVLGAGGRKPTPEDVRALEALVASPPAPPSAFGEIAAEPDALGRWLSRMPVTPELAGMKIAIDLANGAAAVAQDWLEKSDVEWVVTGGGGLPNEQCGSEHLEALGAATVDHGCALGIALDGDGDRCRIVDEQGRPVPGDAVTWLLARHLGVSALAVTVMSNAALEAALSGVDIIRTPVGDKHLQAELSAGRASLGAEESGHILFADHPAGDGLFAGLRVAAAVRRCASASEAFAGFVPLPRRTAKVRVRERPSLDELPELMSACREVEASLGLGGRVFLRYSGTEPVLRILVEGETDDAVRAAMERIAAVATEALA